MPRKQTRCTKPRRVGPLPAAEIREESAAGASDAELAARYGADTSTISRILRGETQPEAGGPIRIAGRPVRGEVATVSVELPAELRDRIDASRGPESRSAWVRRVAIEHLESQVGAPTVVVDGVPVQCRTAEDAARLRTFVARWMVLQSCNDPRA